MKNIIVILALAMILTSVVVFAEEAATPDPTELMEDPSVCFVDDDGDGVCDTCAKTAEECAADAAEGKCATCESCGDKTDK